MPLKFANNQSLTNTTALPSAIPTDNLILISTQTASNSANISFTTGLNGTYDLYEFHFINVRPSTDIQALQFQGSTNGGSSYGVTITSTSFAAYNYENDSGYNFAYDTSYDLAQSTSYQKLTSQSTVGNGADESTSGVLQLFNPASTTYVKHFMCRLSNYDQVDIAVDGYTAGYFNTTSAINALNFNFPSGNIADGIFKLYGVKKS